MPPIYLTPAQPSGSTYPHRGAMARDRASHAGVIIPQIAQHVADQLPALTPGRMTTRRGASMQMASPPASMSSTPYSAEVIKPLTIAPSVAGTVYNATPLSNITNVVSDLRSKGLRGRPILPPGLRDRASDAMTPGMRQRTAVWARAVARFRSKRPTSGGTIHRE